MMNEMKKMKTLTLQGIPFEVVDEAARNDIESVKYTLENLPKNEIITPDLAQNDPTAPDYVKNRTHYEESIAFVDEQTVTTAASEEFYGFCVANLELTGNNAQSDDFRVVFNGDTYHCKKHNGAIGNSGLFGGVDTGEPFLIASTGIMITPYETTATVSVYQDIVKKLDTCFLCDDVSKYGKVGEVTRIEWDGNTSGLDKFIDNGCEFYKVSDFTVPFLHIVSVKAERSDGSISQGCSEQAYGSLLSGYTAAIVTDAENNNIPSNGVYFRYETANSIRCLWMEIDTRRENTALYLNSSSGVKYAITVDDNGTLTATAVT